MSPAGLTGLTRGLDRMVLEITDEVKVIPPRSLGSLPNLDSKASSFVGINADGILALLPPPLWGRVGGGGWRVWQCRYGNWGTPTPNPSPQGSEFKRGLVRWI